MKIIIFGFTGSGKTTYLNKLKQDSKFAGHRFIDLDEYIFTKYSQSLSSLADVISSRGWSWFRNTELEEVKSFLSKENVIISLGGGTVSKDLIRFMSLSDPVYGHYINESFTTCWNRIKNDSSRPIVDIGEEKCKMLYNERVLLFKELESICLKY